MPNRRCGVPWFDLFRVDFVYAIRRGLPPDGFCVVAQREFRAGIALLSIGVLTWSSLCPKYASNSIVAHE